MVSAGSPDILTLVVSAFAQKLILGLVAGSVSGSYVGSRLSTESHIVPRRRFKSSRLVGEFEKPWLNSGKREVNWDSIIFYTCIAIGLGKSCCHHSTNRLMSATDHPIPAGIGGFLCWKETLNVPNHDVSAATIDTIDICRGQQRC
jgi:hypothetical protein